ncbi:isoprenyl transferase [Paenibacillus sp. GCM10023248]|uniref:isoprenyl transferase n=1 Tax=Bacillales TaxID=1385 RepID=UPI0023786A8F|nr:MULTISPECIES: isoprenyl transferase [Bacillales]MDD9270320.1 isoprenyl transferase [Paenibacillus sp. MAHUQ-63]MDR6883893.1 undecaprenyl diphosphate synthase [Bacillus sp. 3255]
MLKLLRQWFGKNNQPVSAARPEIELDKVPAHVAIIMDGNGRWAKQRGLPRVAGHHSGMKNVKKITMAANEIGVKVLTMYAFSTENWKRPKEEVDFLMKLPQEFFPLEIEELIQNNVRIRMTGWREGLPEHTLSAIEGAIERTRNNTGLILNFALNYGGRKEMIAGVQEMIRDVQSGKLQPEELDESRFSTYMLTSDLPDPDLLIRTSGELRLSNFLLWQLAYSELWFTEAYWPEFTESLFLQAIAEYQRRGRRYGGL